MPEKPPKNRRTWKFSLAFGLGLWLCLCAGFASAVPVLELPQSFDQAKTQASTHERDIELNKHWEGGVLAAPSVHTGTASNPETLWVMPDGRFTNRQDHRVWLDPDQRYVTRMSLVSGSAHGSLHLHTRSPRTDAVHMAYRWNGGPWVQASAGDTIAMQRWPLRSPAPSFLIDRQIGQLDLLVEFAHVGSLDTHITLHDPQDGDSENLRTALVVGLLVGICLVVSFSGLWGAWSFGRSSFLMATLLGLAGLGLVALHSGVLPIYVLTHSHRFSDEAKVVINTLWCAITPMSAAVLLSTKSYAPNWWRATFVWLLALVLASVWLKSHDLRTIALPFGIAQAMLTLLFCGVLVLVALVRKHKTEVWAATSIGLFMVGLVVPLLTYTGLLDTGSAFILATAILLSGTLAMFQALVLQYRQGRMVLARARASDLRDALTGLLNRHGFEKRLERELQIAHATQHGGCAFLYLALGDDLQSLHNQHGLEGVETGMVQVSAGLASSFSAVDALGRIGPNVFAVAIPGCPSAQAAHTQAQRLLTQLMKLAAQAAPVAHDARVAVVWLDAAAASLTELERSSAQALAQLPEGKRIAQLDAQAVVSAASSSPVAAAIDDLQREMLGPDTQVQTGFAPTVIETDSPLAPTSNKPHDRAASRMSRIPGRGRGEDPQ
jgi:two-component system, sensor histidine kinase LadS